MSLESPESPGVDTASERLSVTRADGRVSPARASWFGPWLAAISPTGGHIDAWLHYGVPDASTADEIIAWARANSFEVRHTEGSLRVDVGITVRDPDELQLYLGWRGDPISWVASAAHLAEPSNA